MQKKTKVIKELTSVLSNGVKLKEKILKEYRLSPIGTLYIILFYKNVKEEFYSWTSKVELILNKYFPNSRYIAHFTHPRIEEKRFLDVSSDFLNQYCSKLEAHTNALQEIIWNIKEEEIEDIYHSPITVVLNLETGTLQYKENKPIDISPTTQSIKLLHLLLSNKGSVVEYKLIAKEFNLNSYYEGVSNKEVAREVNFIRRDLVKKLKQAGMSKITIDGFISTKKNIGYKIT